MLLYIYVYLLCFIEILLHRVLHRVPTYILYLYTSVTYIIPSTLYMFLNSELQDVGPNNCWFLNPNNLQLFFTSCISRMRKNLTFSTYPPRFCGYTAYTFRIIHVHPRLKHNATVWRVDRMSSDAKNNTMACIVIELKYNIFIELWCIILLCALSRLWFYLSSSWDYYIRLNNIAFLQTSTCETPLIANSKYLYCPPLEIFYPTKFARLCDNKTISRHTLFFFFIPLLLKWLNEKNWCITIILL